MILLPHPLKFLGSQASATSGVGCLTQCLNLASSSSPFCSVSSGAVIWGGGPHARSQLHICMPTPMGMTVCSTLFYKFIKLSYQLCCSGGRILWIFCILSAKRDSFTVVLLTVWTSYCSSLVFNLLSSSLILAVFPSEKSLSFLIWMSSWCTHVWMQVCEGMCV